MAPDPDEAAPGRPSTESGETVADKPQRIGPRPKPPSIPPPPPPDSDDDLPDLDRPRVPEPSRATLPGSSVSLTTAADALRDEEVRRTRQFIAMGWVVSIAAILTVPFLDAPRAMNIAFVAALVWGIVMSSYFFRRFKDPRGYDDTQLLRLAVLCIINAHVVILYYGVFSAGPVVIVIGIHFAARTEAERAARYVLASASIAYVLVAGVIVTGVIDDPGVFATDRALPRTTLAIGMVFVLSVYMLAYYSARALRAVSVSSIEGAATGDPARVATQGADGRAPRGSRARAACRRARPAHRPQRRLVQARNGARTWRDG